MIGGMHLASPEEELFASQDLSFDHIAPERGEVLPPDRSAVAEKGEAAASPMTSRELFLTFDDGPLDCTGKILDILAETGQKATFFVIGRNLTDGKLRKLAIRALEEGHDIGNHSYSHPGFSSISADRAASEILKAHTLIEKVVREAGVNPERQNLYFRFPFGDGGNAWNYRTIQNTLDELGYGEAGWDLDTNDWRMELQWFPRPPAKVIAAMKRARPHDVVLLHDRSTTARYLPDMLNVVNTLELVSTTLSDIELGPRVHTAGNDLDRILEGPDLARTGRGDTTREDALDRLLSANRVPSGRPGILPVQEPGDPSALW
ncbi:MAG: polysaccharide deacetylase family protein [Pseudomonadota bacterium]